ncbi:D-2-hydroxyacid dehydrogenase [Siculibacillus lacustris]|uniref:D-2-hydroxyacid dehydrogenase n=1 Tax=Siculibacillus lacustris TaxID=1549641 RepID=A0A4Q9VUN9_9HYPH|nr:D-2-hydroxyacid dehydrogenase [Siculibacillus lacustris]TBW39473.1 D-2-hydroxyacid dehydrogenase [Siculibacillus lacustris]
MKIVVLDGYTLNPGDLSWDPIAGQGDLTVHDRTAADDVVARIGVAEIVFTNKTVLSRAVLDACPAIRFIGVLATGYNVVDVAAATERGVVVSNIPTYGTAAVAQFATALMLELCHRVGAHDASVHDGEWFRRPDWCYWLNPLVELAGKTLGIVGFGRIGQAFGRIGQALGMTILAFDAYQDESLESPTLRYAGLDELLSQSDVISLHCPLTETNRGMIDAAALAKMKPTAFLLNTSRGPLVVEQDLADALNAGRLAGAALDVLSSEPPARDNPLLTARNCIVTPHIAWAAQAARQRMMTIAEENLAAFLAGRPINVVRP